MGNGKIISFWNDKRVSSNSLFDAFPDLFLLASNQSLLVAEFFRYYSVRTLFRNPVNRFIDCKQNHLSGLLNTVEVRNQYDGWSLMEVDISWKTYSQVIILPLFTKVEWLVDSQTRFGLVRSPPKSKYLIGFWFAGQCWRRRILPRSTSPARALCRLCASRAEDTDYLFVSYVSTLKMWYNVAIYRSLNLLICQFLNCGRIMHT